MNAMVAPAQGRFSDFFLSSSLYSSAPWALGGVARSWRRYLCVLKIARPENASESEEVTGLSAYLLKSRESIQDESA